MTVCDDPSANTIIINLDGPSYRKRLDMQYNGIDLVEPFSDDTHISTPNKAAAVIELASPDLADRIPEIPKMQPSPDTARKEKESSPYFDSDDLDEFILPKEKLPTTMLPPVIKNKPPVGKPASSKKSKSGAMTSWNKFKFGTAFDSTDEESEEENKAEDEEIKMPSFKQPTKSFVQLSRENTEQRRKARRIVLDDEDETQINKPKKPKWHSIIEGLKEMFPNIDGGKVAAMVNACNGNQEKAADKLMNGEDESDVSSETAIEIKILGSRSKPLVIESPMSPASRVTSPIKTNTSPINDITQFFNTASEEEIRDFTNATLEETEILTALRPFDDLNHLKRELQNSKLSRLLIRYEKCRDGYYAVEYIVNQATDCSKLFTQQLSTKSAWRCGSRLTIQLPLSSQPQIVNSKLQLKSYQLYGVSWLLLLYSYTLNGILADEMGVGKTAQVITFLGMLNHIKKGDIGKHLVIVPSSTLTNWEREFNRFAPGLRVASYTGSQSERAEQRQELREGIDEFDVLLTSYNLATGAKDDKSFLKRLGIECLILDEGHMIKNMESSRFKELHAIPTRWRLLMTGTPLQNNLLELFSLLTFIHPQFFLQQKLDLELYRKLSSDCDRNTKMIQLLRPLFTMAQADHTFLSNSRIKNAQAILAPFILRRQKSDVVGDLPQKKQVVMLCKMTNEQSLGYKAERRRGKEEMQERQLAATQQVAEQKKRKKKVVGLEAELANLGETSQNTVKVKGNQLQNIAMQLRKWADHPLLQRSLYSDQILREMSKKLIQDEEFADSSPQLIYEDMTVMSDFEIHQLCCRSRPMKQYILDEQASLQASGKIAKLLSILEDCIAKDEKALVFSQFTMMLDILERVLQVQSIQYTRLDGSTAVAERQAIIDYFQKDGLDTPFVFLLSTKAGGFGVNLTRASTVILFDQDFNPHNDKQAEDRAHRVGQQREVTVYRLVTQHSIEEQMLRCAQRKLELDEKMQKYGQDDKDDIGFLSLCTVESRLLNYKSTDIIEDVLKEELHEDSLE